MPATLRAFATVLALSLLAPVAASEVEDKMPDLDEVQAVVELFLENDPSMQEFFDDAYGYVVFPSVGKGGFIIGGAYGRGAVYDDGVLVGAATLKQATIGFQLGGQKYAQAIFFRSEASFNDFISGNYELSAQASAIAASAGAASTAAYDHGVTVFTIGISGLMYEATVGGQKFRYWSLSED
jgi:lipid-binding SYLF domain-containing protein